MTTEQAITLDEDITGKVELSRKEHLKDIDRDIRGKHLLDTYVLPCMPRSLAEHLRTTYVSFILSKTLRIDFTPRKRDYSADLVLGTIRKVESGLVNGGWTVVDGLTPEAYGSSLLVRLDAFREVTDKPGKAWLARAWDKARGRETIEPEPYTLHVKLMFDHLSNTEHCQIVEREVTVEAVPEHTETKTVLVCDEEGWDKDGQ